MTEHPRTAISVAIRTDLKAKYDFFIAWLKRYHAEEGIWTQNTSMDEVLSNSDRWQEFLTSEKEDNPSRFEEE